MRAYTKIEICRATKTLREIYKMETGQDDPLVKIDSFLADLQNVLDSKMRIDNNGVVDN